MSTDGFPGAQCMTSAELFLWLCRMLGSWAVICRRVVAAM